MPRCTGHSRAGSAFQARRSGDVSDGTLKPLAAHRRGEKLLEQVRADLVNTRIRFYFDLGVGSLPILHLSPPGHALTRFTECLSMVRSRVVTKMMAVILSSRLGKIIAKIFLGRSRRGLARRDNWLDRHLACARNSQIRNAKPHFRIKNNGLSGPSYRDARIGRR